MKKIVVKIGSSLIAPSGNLDMALLAELVKDIIEAQNQGYKVILVSSGAIACGAHKLGLKKKPTDTHSLMAIASLGQIVLMDAYSDAFAAHKKSCAQILLTWDDFDNRKRFLNARSTIAKLLSLDIIPIINENDAVSCDEIKFGDNDRLSALVADLTRAETLIILSDVPGLLDGTRLVPVIEKIDANVLALVRREDKALTSGGMFTKLEAAKISLSLGVQMIIASGREEKVISRIAAGEHLGTLFVSCGQKHTARKRWIAFSKKIKGMIYVDDGAAEAITHRGKSLLCVGITKTEGEFKRKDSVEVVDSHGNILGCGLVNYSADELVNCRSKKLEQEVIHRDNFVQK
ncbi:MAG: glutamate 5-kinase [Candidatus Omnitrophota bacterium]